MGGLRKQLTATQPMQSSGRLINCLVGVHTDLHPGASYKEKEKQTLTFGPHSSWSSLLSDA